MNFRDKAKQLGMDTAGKGDLEVWQYIQSHPCCPKCGSDYIDITWQTGNAAFPEWERGDCFVCGAVWNECAKQK